jgi:hypothetical protein
MKKQCVKKSLHSGAPRLFGHIVPENMKLAVLELKETAAINYLLWYGHLAQTYVL